MKRTFPSASLPFTLTLCLTAPALGSLALAQPNSSAADRAAQKVAPANSPAVLCGLTLANGSGTAKSGNTASGNTASGNSGPGKQNQGNSRSGTGGKSSSDTEHAGDHSSGQGSNGSSGASDSGREAAMQGVVAGKKVSGMDLCFAQQAATSDLFEITSSRLATGQASSSQVKALAGHLIRDHTASGAKLSALAPRLGIALPRTLPAPKLAEVNALRVQKGAGFDRAFAAAQVTAHEQAVNLFSIRT